MGPRKEWDDDDGRTIADMTGVGRPGLLIPRLGGRKSSAGRGLSDSAQRGPEGQTAKERPWENESEFTPKERGMYVLGALKAAILIALAFIVGLGAAVWLMIQVWT